MDTFIRDLWSTVSIYMAQAYYNIVASLKVYQWALVYRLIGRAWINPAEARETSMAIYSQCPGVYNHLHISKYVSNELINS